MPHQTKALKLFLSHRAQLFSYATRLTGDRVEAEDVLQEAWIRYCAATKDRALEEPAGYLHRIVRNLALDGRRRRGVRIRFLAEDADAEAATIASELPTAETTIISSEELRLVLEVLDAMPERMRIAVEMHRIDGAKLKEIASHLNMSITAVHQLIGEGIERCRARLRNGSS